VGTWGDAPGCQTVVAAGVSAMMMRDQAAPYTPAPLPLPPRSEFPMRFSDTIADPTSCPSSSEPANAREDYYRNYDRYLANQQHLFGPQ
jgi:hypothetical protein